MKVKKYTEKALKRFVKVPKAKDPPPPPPPLSGHRLPPAEVKESWYQTRKRVNDIKINLPPGVLGPFFNDEFGDVDSLLYVLTGQDFTLRELKDEAEIIRQASLRVPSVAKVRFYGEQAECIYVELNHAKLATLGVTAQTIFTSIAKQNAVIPAGDLETAADTIYLRVDGALKGTEALAEVPIQSNGKIFGSSTPDVELTLAMSKR